MAEEQLEITGVAASRLLVLDANILLRAVLGVRVRSLIETYSDRVPMFIPADCVAEVRQYLPALCAKRNWDAGPSSDLLSALLTQVREVEAGFYREFEKQARRRIGFRDAKDWPLVALALTLDAPIWTEDTDFFGSGLAIWTTETVEIYLDDEPWMLHEPPPPPYGQPNTCLRDTPRT